MTNVVAVGGLVTENPVELQADVKELNAIARSVVDAIGISNCVARSDSIQPSQPAVDAARVIIRVINVDECNPQFPYLGFRLIAGLWDLC